MTIKENERAIIEKAYSSGYALPNPPSIRTGKKVAVIGSVLRGWQLRTS